METGFGDISREELCREWYTIMENTTTVKDLLSSIRFLRICQELECRKIELFDLGKILVKTTENLEHHQAVER